VNPRPPAEAILIDWLRSLPEAALPAVSGPLCAGWYAADPYGPGCEHPTCDPIAYGGPPPHDCPVEADHDDPISQHYGIYLATCDICRAWERASR
jgi:hypothetical protein